MNRLTARGAIAARPGKHADGAGLWLVKSEANLGKWVLRMTVHGRRREMGLGAWPAVALSEAREVAKAARREVRSGLDPIHEREKRRQAAARNLHTFEEIAKGAFEARKSELKNDGKAGRWFSPIELHLLPKLGKPGRRNYAARHPGLS